MHKYKCLWADNFINDLNKYAEDKEDENKNKVDGDDFSSDFYVCCCHQYHEKLVHDESLKF